MKKVNLERKIEQAIHSLTNCLVINKDYPNTAIDVMRFEVINAISILCMTDDFEVEERTSYYCLSEIERNLTNYVEERKRKENENVDRRINSVGEVGKRFQM